MKGAILKSQGRTAACKLWAHSDSSVLQLCCGSPRKEPRLCGFERVA